jgi:hypothetical protein
VSNQRTKPIQILVYDNSIPSIKSDELCGWLCRYLGIDVIEGEIERAFIARNYVVSLAKTRYVWLLDDDIVPWYNCLEEMINTFNIMEAELVEATQHNIAEDWNKPQLYDKQRFGMRCSNILFDKLIWDKAVKNHVAGEDEDEEDEDGVYIAEQLIFNNNRAYVSSKAISVRLKERGYLSYRLNKEWICKNLTMLKGADIEFLLRNFFHE